MSIKIKVVTLPDGMLRIKSIDALSTNKLPDEYLKGYPHCVMRFDVLILRYDSHTYTNLKIGDVVLEYVFINTYIRCIRESGNRLHMINHEGDVRTYEV